MLTPAHSSVDYVFLGPAPPFRGGIANYNVELARSFAEIGTVQLINFTTLYPEILFPGSSQFVEKPPTLSIPSARVISSVNPFTWRQVARSVANLAPRAVICQWWHPFFAFAYFAVTRYLVQRKIPVVMICHNVVPHESTKLDHLLLRLAYHNIACFITQSTEERQQLQRFRPDADITVNVHPAFQQFPEPPPGLTPPVQLPERELTLLFFGLIREYKGVKYLLYAIPEIQEGISVHVIIAGEFYQEVGEYKALIRSLNIESAVTIMNRYIPDEEVGWYFRQANLVVLPYVSATQSGVIPLAYQFRKPVIATTVGGLPDVVFPGKTGYLVAPGDAHAIAQGVKQFNQDRNTTDFAGAIEEILPMFSWEHLRQAILNLLPQ